ncbi:MAG TPA: lytic transglycosylase domain-containing protein [Rhodopseudomonas sp.]|uniref:lytic transglycosylase domain-containing protein n=1 Tax=Rhodopseudomonas sp. TaxID=1078 RepID=UPI002ED8CD4F
MTVDASTSSATSAAASRAQIAGAIKQAAGSTGTNFSYLVTTAKMESNFDPTAAASTSSAKGLYQFIEQTWLGTVKEAGSQFGYGQYADAISKSASGSYSVSDPAAKAAILKLRDDPVASSAMAGVLTQSNSFKLTGEIGRRPTDSELYMAHFMGVGGAAKLISNAENNPSASGAALFPNAAAANRSIFYDRSGNARSVSQVYSELASRYDQAANSPSALATMAAGGGAPISLVASAAAPADSGAYLSSFPDLRSATSASATSDSPTTTAQYQPGFRSLYQPGDRAEPVSATVQELWGNRAATASGASTASSSSDSSVSSALAQTPNVRPPQPLDLFSDRAGTFSG